MTTITKEITKTTTTNASQSTNQSKEKKQGKNQKALKLILKQYEEIMFRLTNIESIMGEIQGVARVKNDWTDETLYILNIISNELEFDVCICAKDLLGEPEVGRRFKGRIWMQGNVTGYR